MEDMLERLYDLRKDCARIVQKNYPANPSNCAETAKLALHWDRYLADFESYWTKLFDYLIENTDVQQCEDCGEWCQEKLCDDCKPSTCWKCHGSGCCPSGPAPSDFGDHVPCRICEGTGVLR